MCGAVIDTVLVDGESANQQQAAVALNLNVEVEVRGDNDGAPRGEVEDDLGRLAITSASMAPWWQIPACLQCIHG